MYRWGVGGLEPSVLACVLPVFMGVSSHGGWGLAWRMWEMCINT